MLLLDLGDLWNLEAPKNDFHGFTSDKQLEMPTRGVYLVCLLSHKSIMSNRVWTSVVQLLLRIAECRPQITNLKPNMTRRIEGFTVADVILEVGQTGQNLQWMYGKNRDFDAR